MRLAGTRLPLRSPCGRCEPGVAKAVCCPATFGLGQQIPLPLTRELEVNG
jgi:hypothetical protein